MVLSSIQLYLEVVLRLCETGRWERYAGRPYELAGGENLKKENGFRAGGEWCGLPMILCMVVAYHMKSYRKS